MNVTIKIIRLENNIKYEKKNLEIVENAKINTILQLEVLIKEINSLKDQIFKYK